MPDLFEEMSRRLQEAKKARPDVSPEDLLFTILGEKQVNSIQEVNADGEEMIFLCLRVSTATIVVEGSVKKSCSSCKEEVWMSPATCQTFDRLQRKRIVCEQCVQKEVPSD